MSSCGTYNLEWELYPAELQREKWNDVLLALDGCNFFQTYEWGEYKRSRGWQPLRMVRRDEFGDVVAMVQALVRVYLPRVHVIWIPGGPSGRVTDWAVSLPRGVVGSQRSWLWYLRLNSVRAQDSADMHFLADAGWRRPRTRLGSRLSMQLKIDSETGKNFSMLSTNWRHNLRRARKTNIVVEEWPHPVAAEVARLYREMEDYKGLTPHYGVDDLESMFAVFRDRLLMYRCLTEDGRLLAIRACGVVGTRAWDLLAATNVAGRRVYASYAVCWELIERCRQLGIRRYDFSGVDPERTPGVFNFKRGSGAELFEYLGEWEISSPAFCGNLVNPWLRRL